MFYGWYLFEFELVAENLKCLNAKGDICEWPTVPVVVVTAFYKKTLHHFTSNKKQSFAPTNSHCFPVFLGRPVIFHLATPNFVRFFFVHFKYKFTAFSHVCTVNSFPNILDNCREHFKWLKITLRVYKYTNLLSMSESFLDCIKSSINRR